jgi:hypothetical protein
MMELSKKVEVGADPRPPEPSVDHELHDKTKKHIVVIVHGIRDFALWQNSVRSVLEGAGFEVEATNYGRLNLVQFLLPLRYFRKRAIATVWRQIRIVRQNKPQSPISVVAHSFGTFVISHLMKENFDIEFHRIIFCGSVVPYGFEYEQIQNRFTPPIINEVGTRDIWPAMAESITWGYGSAGTYGFRRPLVRDRWHNGARHGYFLDRSFCEQFWVPFLKDGKTTPGAESPERPRAWLQLLSIFRLKYVIALLATGLMIFFYQADSAVQALKKTSPSPSSSTDVAQSDEPQKIPPTFPPGRLLSASPFRVRFDSRPGGQLFASWISRQGRFVLAEPSATERAGQDHPCDDQRSSPTTTNTDPKVIAIEALDTFKRCR